MLYPLKGVHSTQTLIERTGRPGVGFPPMAENDPGGQGATEAAAEEAHCRKPISQAFPLWLDHRAYQK